MVPLFIIFDKVTVKQYITFVPAVCKIVDYQDVVYITRNLFFPANINPILIYNQPVSISNGFRDEELCLFCIFFQGNAKPGVLNDFFRGGERMNRECFFSNKIYHIAGKFSAYKVDIDTACAQFFSQCETSHEVATG